MYKQVLANEKMETSWQALKQLMRCVSGQGRIDYERY